jgi:phosphoglucomutase
LDEHYAEFGRNYFSRYDYENLPAKETAELYKALSAKLPTLKGSSISGYEVEHADDFEYLDPVDKSVAKGQGLRILFTDGSRIIFRLSGTGSQGATLRIYVEKYSRTDLNLQTSLAIKDLIQIALELAQLEKFTGRKDPTVIT